jgi:hypothetical protein
VAPPGERQRSKEIDANAFSRGQELTIIKQFNEVTGSAHGPDGVRAGRPDADLEEIENAERQDLDPVKKGHYGRR